MLSLMNLDFLTLYPQAFGLDLSDLSLKIANLKKTKKGLRLVSYGEWQIPQGFIVQGEIKSEDEVAMIIKNAVHSLKLPPFAAASLPEEKAFLQVIQLPKLKQEEIKGAATFEAENYIPFPVDTVYLDAKEVFPIKNSLDHMDVLLAAHPKQMVDSYLSCLTKAGLVPKVLEIESLATARALVEKETSDFPVLLLDLGATRTGFAVFAGKSLRFTASIPISSTNFTQTLAQSLSVSFEEAEELKKAQGMQEALLPLMQELVAHIKKFMGYYESHASHQHLTHEEKKIRSVLLAGGGANLKGLKELLQKELETPIALGNPWVNIFEQNPAELPPLPFGESLQYATALGLALRGLSSND